MKTTRQGDLFEAVISELSKLGYQGDLLQYDYRFADWFSQNEERSVPAAAFAQTPLGYDSACFAVVISNGESGASLINQYRALGAPRAFEVRPDRVIHWRVSAQTAPTDEQLVIAPEEIGAVFREHRELWRPRSVHRAKNIAAIEPRQPDFIDARLIPALEQHVRAKLDPLLRDILHVAQQEYLNQVGHAPDHDKLYRLVFRALAGKIMHDRGLPQFAFANRPDPEDILGKVERHYNDGQPIVRNRPTQRVVVEKLWDSISLMNISVEILAFIWEYTLVTTELRQEYGIHATPPSIARYIVNRLPFEEIPEEARRVVEPCCGSGAFLIAALQRLRELLPPTMDPRERHRYFTKMLSGFDTEPFGLEVARSCLMLADFPNPNGWHLADEDIFDSSSETPKFIASLQKARIVLCNPPFQNFTDAQQEEYDVSFAQKPAEALWRVLEHLPAAAILGFVLPHQALDGHSYRFVRKRLAERFSDLEIVHLPEGVFHEARLPSVLLLAKEPSRGDQKIRVSYSRVQSAATFLNTGKVDWAGSVQKTPTELEDGLGIIDLPDVWDYLSGYPRLGEAVEEITRGVEWVEFSEERHISERPLPGFLPGFYKSEEMFCFEPPPAMFLCAKEGEKKWKVWERQWKLPKVICNATRRTMGPWRIVACPVDLNLLCSQNFTVIWPKLPWTVKSLSAVLNGPVACAFVATRERWKHLTIKTMKGIPLPVLDKEQIARLDALVGEYQKLAALRRDFPEEDGLFGTGYPPKEKLKDLLRQIDLEILAAYKLPAEILKTLVAYFQGHRRTVPFEYGIESIFQPLRNLTPEEEAEEASASWELLKKALDQDRLSDRKFFP